MNLKKSNKDNIFFPMRKAVKIRRIIIPNILFICAFIPGFVIVVYDSSITLLTFYLLIFLLLISGINYYVIPGFIKSGIFLERDVMVIQGNKQIRIPYNEITQVNILRGRLIINLRKTNKPVIIGTVERIEELNEQLNSFISV